MDAGGTFAPRPVCGNERVGTPAALLLETPKLVELVAHKPEIGRVVAEASRYMSAALSNKKSS